MQRFFTPFRKRCLAGTVTVMSVAVAGAGAHALHLKHEAQKRAGEETGRTVPVRPHALAPQIVAFGKSETGKASWYGTGLLGKLTASGEHFDPAHLTCAHRTLPLGSLLRVTNLHTKKSVLVRVNDRGPMLEDRILDLSRAAAQQIGLYGLAQVRVERVHKVEVHSAAAQTAAQHAAAIEAVRAAVAQNDPQAIFPFLEHRR